MSSIQETILKQKWLYRKVNDFYYKHGSFVRQTFLWTCYAKR